MSIVINGQKYFGIIYKIENTITHKVYIGQTTHPRGFNGRYLYKGTGIERVYKDLKSKQARGARGNVYLLRSIEACGFDAFKVDEIFDTALTFEELNEKEAYYIDKFDSYKNGYNMTSGGDSVSGYSRPTGKDCLNSKPVCQIDPFSGQLIKTWDSATEACEAIGVNSASVSNVCKGKIKTAGGFIWVLEKDYNPDKIYKVNPLKKDLGRGTKPVLLLDADGNIVQEFYSLNSVSNTLDICPQSVSDICNHKIKHGKYNLVFKSEYIEEQRLSVRGSYEEVS